MKNLFWIRVKSLKYQFVRENKYTQFKFKKKVHYFCVTITKTCKLENNM